MVKIKKLISVVMIMTMLLGICMSFPVSAIEENQNSVQFKGDGTFKIMQISDLQDSAIMLPITRDFIRDCVKREQPDLVVLTGDNIAGGAASGGNKLIDRIKTTSAINCFMSVFQKYDVPVVQVFGNHDAEKNFMNKEEQMKMYMKYSCFLGIDEGEDVSGCGTYNLPILSSSGDKVKFNLWLFDSGMQDEVNGGYDHIKQDQLDWYVKKSNELKENNGGEVVNSLAFQHIIVPEIYDLMKEVPAGTQGAIERAGKNLVIDEKYLASGAMNEEPCPGTVNGGELQTLAQQGDVLAMFFGHDHTNTFVAKHPCGIDLVNTPGAGFWSYGDANRGVRIIELNEKDTSTYDTSVLTYHDFYEGDKTAELRFKAYASEYSVSERVSAGIQYVLALISDFISGIF